MGLREVLNNIFTTNWNLYQARLRRQFAELCAAKGIQVFWSTSYTKVSDTIVPCSVPDIRYTRPTGENLGFNPYVKFKSMADDLENQCMDRVNEQISMYLEKSLGVTFDIDNLAGTIQRWERITSQIKNLGVGEQTVKSYHDSLAYASIAKAIASRAGALPVQVSQQKIKQAAAHPFESPISKSEIAARGRAGAWQLRAVPHRLGEEQARKRREYVSLISEEPTILKPLPDFDNFMWSIARQGE